MFTTVPAPHEPPMIRRRSLAGLEYAVLLCLAVIAILAESGLLGGTLSLAP